MLTRRSGATQSCEIPGASGMMAPAFRERYRAGLVPRQRDILMALTSTVWDSDSSPSASDHSCDRGGRGCSASAPRRRTWGTCTAESLSGHALEPRVRLRSDGGGCAVADDEEDDGWETYVPSPAHEEELEADNATWARGLMSQLEAAGDDAEVELVEEYELSTQKLQSESSGPLPTAPLPLITAAGQNAGHTGHGYRAQGEPGPRQAYGSRRSSSASKSSLRVSCEPGAPGPGSTGALHQGPGLQRRSTGPQEYRGSPSADLGRLLGPAGSEGQHGDLGSHRQSLRRKGSAKRSAKQLLCRRARSWGISENFPEELIFPGALPSVHSMGRSERRPAHTPFMDAPRSGHGPTAPTNLAGAEDAYRAASTGVQATHPGDAHAQASCRPHLMLFAIDVGYNVPTSSDTPTSPDPASPKPLFPSHARRLSASIASPGSALHQAASPLASSTDNASPLQADEGPHREASMSSNSSYPVPEVPAPSMERPQGSSRSQKSGASPKLSAQQRKHHERVSSWDSSDMDGSYAFSPSQFLRHANDSVAGHSPSRRSSRRTQSFNSSRFRPVKLQSGKPAEAAHSKDTPQKSPFARHSTWAPRSRAAPVADVQSQGPAGRGRRESGTHISGVPRHPRSKSGIPATGVPHQKARGDTKSQLNPGRMQAGPPKVEKRLESAGTVGRPEYVRWNSATSSVPPGAEALGMALHRRATTWGSPGFVCNNNILHALAEITSDETSEGEGWKAAAPAGIARQESGTQSETSMVKGFLEGLLWGEGAISRPTYDAADLAVQNAQAEQQEPLGDFRFTAADTGKETSKERGVPPRAVHEPGLTRRTSAELARLGMCATDLSGQATRMEATPGHAAAAHSLLQMESDSASLEPESLKALLGAATQQQPTFLSPMPKADAVLAEDGGRRSSIGPLSRQLPVPLALSAPGSAGTSGASTRVPTWNGQGSWKGKKPQLTVRLPDSRPLKASSNAPGQGPGLPRGAGISTRYQRSASGGIPDPFIGPRSDLSSSRSTLPPVSPLGSSLSARSTEMFTRIQTAPSTSRYPHPLASAVHSFRSGSSPMSAALHHGSRPPVSPCRPLYSPSSNYLTSPCLTSPSPFSPSFVSPGTASSRPPPSPTSPWMSSPGASGLTKSPDGRRPPNAYRRALSQSEADSPVIDGHPGASKSPKGVLKAPNHGRASSVVSGIMEELAGDAPRLRKSVSFSSSVTVHELSCIGDPPGLSTRAQSPGESPASRANPDLGQTKQGARNPATDSNPGMLKNRRRHTNDCHFNARPAWLEGDESKTGLSSARLSAPACCEGAADSVGKLDLPSLQSRFPAVAYEYTINKFHGRTLVIDVPDY